MSLKIYQSYGSVFGGPEARAGLWAHRLGDRTGPGGLDVRMPRFPDVGLRPFMAFHLDVVLCLRGATSRWGTGQGGAQVRVRHNVKVRRGSRWGVGACGDSVPKSVRPPCYSPDALDNSDGSRGKP